MTKGCAIIQETSKKLTVSYEDFDVEAFGGSDYEAIYTLDAKQKEKLRRELLAEGLGGSLKEMILEHFGEYLDKEPFSQYCDRHGIKYDLFTWIS